MMERQNYEARLTAIEDRFAIYDLLAAHPLSADSADANYTAQVYMKDAVFDRGSEIEGARGIENLVDLFRRPEHKEAIDGGLAHFASLPLVDLRDNEAFATSYLLLIYLNHEGKTYILPNHGPSQGYLVHRVVINRWHFKKIEGSWRIQSRILLPTDGSEDHLSILSKGLAGLIAARNYTPFPEEASS